MDPQVPPQNNFEPTPKRPNRLASLLQSSSKQVLAAAVVLVLVVVGVLALTTQKPTPVPGTKKEQTRQQETALIRMSKDGFTPATINIKKGDVVTWTNDNDSPVHIASDPHPTNDILPGLDSEESLNKGDSYSYTFEKSGTFTYHDHLNPLKYTGTIVVE